MITAPANWNTLWNSEFDLELRFTIDGVNYYNDSILLNDGRLTHYLYTTYGIGNACIGQFTISLIDPQPIARGVRQCTLACRLTDGTLTTSWVPQGTFYLNTVEKDTDGNYKLGLFDGLALCDVYLYPGGVVPSSVSYPRAATTEIRAICTKAGIPAPSDLSAFTGMQVTAPTNMTCRQILQSLAAMAGGNWTMAKDGKLKFIPLGTYTGTPAYTVTVSGITQTSDRLAVTGVSLTNNSEQWEYGSDSGIMLDARCVYATQSVATAVYNKVLNKQYQGYSLDGVYLSPLVELGDYIEVAGSGERLLLDNYTVMYSQGLWGTVMAPMRAEVEQRIKYQTDQERQINNLGQLAEDNANAIEAMGTAEYISDLIGRINEQANETGGYTYIVEGEGIRTYDVPIDDLSDDSAAHAVVEIKGGTIRIANSRDSLGNWQWKTVFTSGHIAADLVTAASIVTGFIGSPSGNYWNLDTGELRMDATTIEQITDEVLPQVEPEIATKAAEAAKTEVAKVEVGGTNLLIDTNHNKTDKRAADANRYFSTNAGTNVTNTLVSISTTNRPTGGVTTALQSAFKASQSGKYSGICYYNNKAVKLLEGQQYTVSCWAKRSGGAANVFFQYGQTLYKASARMALTTGWKRYYFTFTFKQTDVGGTEGARIYFYTTPTTASTTTTQICGMKLETGSKATDWSEAPEDTNYGIANAEALAKTYTNAITKKDRDYTDQQRKEIDASFNQAKIAQRLFGYNAKTGKYSVQGITIKNGQLYINGSYINTGTLNAGIIKAGVLMDKKGKVKWNLSTGYLYTSNAEFYNSTVLGTLTSGSSYKVQFNSGTVRFFNGNKNAVTIDGAMRFTDGSYGGHITFSKYLVLRGPQLAVTNYTTSNGKIGYSGTVTIKNVTFNMNNNMSRCYSGDVILDFCNGMLLAAGGSSGLVKTKNRKW